MQADKPSADTESIYSQYLRSTGISTDSRNISSGCLYIALKGPSFNGNAFAAEALAKGAAFAIVDEAQYAENNKIILVPDGLKALQELAAHHRKQFNIPFIAVCGSNGKTTTKELLSAVLSAKYKTFSTPGNLNNHIGVPLSLLRIAPGTEMAVIEIGANAPGEIAELCEIAAPTHGLITNIGRDHLEGFGTVEGTAKANGEMFRYLEKNGGTAFVNTREDYLDEQAKGISNIITYPETGDNFTCKPGPSGFFLSILMPDGRLLNTKMAGSYNFANAATALCLASFFGVPDTDANAALCAYTPANNRSQLIETGKNTLILDAYNANPSSMTAALESFAAIQTDKPRMVIVGDMLELGSESFSEHEALGVYLAFSSFEIVMLVGPECVAAADNCPEALYFKNRQLAEAYMKEIAFSGYVILLKASRGIGLEKLAALL
ncbi:MAG: UDP-N-acetylmuramoyl-tripeptide--D-alanyl-D-alanine ligase [Bacteroidota bacterium]